jgi:bis(5'-nucleosyl)-tetraphosphatase (symmetrical)
MQADSITAVPMPTYAIGDIQGCFTSLMQLLDEIGFTPGHDRLWFVGDLVNRGEGSLQTLRWCRRHDEDIVCVLGNHDLHLLAVAEGVAKASRNDTLQTILDAPDRDALLDWLRHRPLVHRESGWLMVHAGLLPEWTADEAVSLAGEAETALGKANYRDFLARMYGNRPDRWSPDLRGINRLRMIVNAFTRLRVCTPDGIMEFRHKGLPDHAPEGYQPWFRIPGRRSADVPIVCGHWSALGLVLEDNLVALDTGCLWGGAMTSLRLEDRRVFRVACPTWKCPDWRRSTRSH